jgi:putative aldouronate transport system permease protein
MTSCRKHKALMLIALPVVMYFLLFRYVPMLGQIIAFKNYVIADGIFGSEWTGLDNFRQLFGGSDFFKVLRNTLVISFLRLTFGFAAPIVFALLLNELRLALYKRAVQTLSYLPHFFSWVILGGMFMMIFSGNGPVNHLVALAGSDTIPFLTKDGWFIFILIATGIWQGAGYGAIIYLAALSGISPDLYEAASIDGAGRWKQTLHITLPSLVPTIVTLFILGIGHILAAGFDQIYNLYNPMVFDVADVIETYVLRQMIGMNFSIATAAGLFKGAVGLVLVASANAVAKKISGGEQGVW